MLAGVAITMVWLVWRYNRKRQPVPLSQKDHNLWLEVTWTTIPTVLVMLMFWYGWEGYLSLRRIPDDALEIRATGRMWSWLFTYGNGKTADKARQEIKARLTEIVPIFNKQKFMLGDEFSMLDVAIAPLLWRLDYYGIDLSKNALPLLKYAERIFSRPAYIEALTPSEKVMRR